MLIDTHCHLNFPDFDEDRQNVITNAKKAGVKKFIVPGCDFVTSKNAVNLAEKFPDVIFAAVGFHPYETDHDPDIKYLELLIQTTIKQLNNLTICAIGECGLDYHRFNGEAARGKKDRQKFLLEEHALLALRYKLPLILHVREAWEDIFTVLDSLPDMPKGVLHCFSGGLQDIRMAKERNLFVGIDGNITYSKHLQTILHQIPLEMLLLETDSPLLTPIPLRGKRNEPKNLKIISSFIAKLLNNKPIDIEKITTQNAIQLFTIDI